MEVHFEIPSHLGVLKVRINAQPKPGALRRQPELARVALNRVTKGKAGEADPYVPT
jgi:hypothetical protein